MKTQFGQMAGKIILFVFFVVLALSSSCKKEQRNDVLFKNIEIKRDSVPKPDTATAIMNAAFDNDTKYFSYSIVFGKELHPTKIYFDKGVPINPKDSIIGPYTSPVTGTTKALKPEEEEKLNNGQWSVHIKTKLDTTGNIKAIIK